MNHRECEREERERVAKAAKNLDDWASRWGGEGLSGSVRMQTQQGTMVSKVYERPVGDSQIAQRVVAQIPTNASSAVCLPAQHKILSFPAQDEMTPAIQPTKRSWLRRLVDGLF